MRLCIFTCTYFLVSIVLHLLALFWTFVNCNYILIAEDSLRLILHRADITAHRQRLLSQVRWASLLVLQNTDECGALHHIVCTWCIGLLSNPITVQFCSFQILWIFVFPCSVVDLNLDYLQQVYCPFCVHVKLFEQLGATYKATELDVESECT
jgi:hypothetical protein